MLLWCGLPAAAGQQKNGADAAAAKPTRPPVGDHGDRQVGRFSKRRRLPANRDQ
jgi:hypothetical protein